MQAYNQKLRTLRLDQRQSRHPAHIVITSPSLSINIVEKHNSAYCRRVEKQHQQEQQQQKHSNSNNNRSTATIVGEVVAWLPKRLHGDCVATVRAISMEIVWQPSEPSTWRLCGNRQSHPHGDCVATARAIHMEIVWQRPEPSPWRLCGNGQSHLHGD